MIDDVRQQEVFFACCAFFCFEIMSDWSSSHSECFLKHTQLSRWHLGTEGGSNTTGRGEKTWCHFLIPK